jgi:hypothetical protein
MPVGKEFVEQVATVPEQVVPPRSQYVPAGLKPSVGQPAVEPVQFSARSQGPTAVRQTVVELAKESAGQVAALPVQFSATSQTPAAARQTVLELRKALAGQVPALPVQFSATSQGPATARQTMVFALYVQVEVQQGPFVAFDGSHSSPGSTTPLPHSDPDVVVPVGTFDITEMLPAASVVLIAKE